MNINDFFQVISIDFTNCFRNEGVDLLRGGSSLYPHCYFSRAEGEGGGGGGGF